MTAAERSISYRVEHQCPQCGAPVTLGEETLFFVCEFCRVRSCISQKGVFRYMLSPGKSVPEDTELIYLPYWRFKGVRYFCSVSGVDSRFMDISQSAVNDSIEHVPSSLGFRSQALPLKLIRPETRGTFLTPASFKESIRNLDRRFSRGNQSAKPLFAEDIGEMTSLIYAPFYVSSNRLIDAVLDKPLDCRVPEDFSADRHEACRPEKETVFVPGICPSCGWDLQGGADSLALVCRNCNTLWRPHGKRLAKIRFRVFGPRDPDAVYLPFWRIRADLSGLKLSSHADLVKACNLPMVVRPEMENRELHFWAPAFKIRPKVFLRLSTQLLLAQLDSETEKSLQNREIHPVTLPGGEAVQSIRVTLASLLKPARDYLPALSCAEVKPTDLELIFLPFENGPHELFHPDLNIGINRNILALSGNL